MSSSFPLPLSTHRRFWLMGLFVSSAVFLGPLNAADEKLPSFSEKTSELFGKIAPLTKEENWKEVINLITAAVATLPPDSYDRAELLSSKGIALLQIENYPQAIEPLEESLRISDAHKGFENPFFEKPKTIQIVEILAKLYAQEGQSAKIPAAQEANYSKSVGYLRRLLKDVPRPRADTRLLFAQIAVQYATINSEKINAALMKEAKAEVEKVLYSTVKPTESTYALLQFAVQQEGNMEKSAELLELMVSLYPTKANYWQTLMATYSSLAQTHEKSPEKMRQYYIRAINTIERAQAYSFLKTPKDQYNLVTLYTLAGQFGRSTDLLHAGLRNGTIESDLKNWIQLAYAYQQAHLDLQAINSLKEAQKLFPKSGQLPFNIGNIYYSLDDMKNANQYFREAMAKKDDLDKSKYFPTLRVIAFTSLELGQFDDALKALEEAEKMPEAKSDAGLARMKEAILHEIEERNDKAKKDAEKTKAPAVATP